MQVLEKILKEIDEAIARYGENPYIDEKVTDLCYGLNIAKDIIRKHMNDDWIPVDRGLPEEGQEVWVAENTDCVRRGTYTEAFGFGMRKGFICSDGFMCIGNVLAWKPYMYPEPYRPERSKE